MLFNFYEFFKQVSLKKAMKKILKINTWLELKKKLIFTQLYLIF